MKKLLILFLMLGVSLVQAKPILQNNFPVSDANSVHPSTTLELVFDVPVKASQGFMYIKDYSSDHVYFQFAVKSNIVRINHNKVSIKLNSNLPLAKKLYVHIDSNAFEDAQEEGSFFKGIHNKHWNFTTASYVIAHTSFSPQNNATCIPINTQLSIQLTQSVTIGNGLVKIINRSNNKVVEQFRASSGQMQKESHNSKKYIITLKKPLLHNTTYCVCLENTSFYNTTGAYSGLHGSEWCFTTVSQSPIVNSKIVSKDCQKTTFRLEASTPNASKIFWYDEKGNKLKEDHTLEVSISADKTYFATAIVNSCQTPMTEINLTVEKDQIAISEDQSISQGEEIQLTASGGVVYQWSPSADLSDPTSNAPFAKPSKTTTYQVTITTSQGCTFQKEVTITVESEGSVFLPNLFTPNHDKQNDLFRVLTKDTDDIDQIDFRIYNQSGVLLYQTRDVDQAVNIGWDGTANGVDQPTNTYIWHLSGAFKNGKMITFEGKNKGTIVLVR